MPDPFLGNLVQYAASALKFVTASLLHRDDETLTNRGSLAAEGPDVYASRSVPEKCIPSWSATLPIRRRTVSNERHRRLRPRTTWRPSNGHRAWTSPALRTLRCAAFAEKEGKGSKRKVTTDATLELLRTNSRTDRLKRRIEAIEDRREGYAVSDATHPEGGQDAVLSGVLGTGVGTGQPQDMS